MPGIPKHKSSPKVHPWVLHPKELASHVVNQVDEKGNVTDKKEGGKHHDRDARPVFPSTRLGLACRLPEFDDRYEERNKAKDGRETGQDDIDDMFELSPEVVVAVRPVPGVLELSPERGDEVLEEGEEREEEEVTQHPRHYFSSPDLVVGVQYDDCPKGTEQENEKHGEFLEDGKEYLPQSTEQVVVEDTRMSVSKQGHCYREMRQRGEGVHAADNRIEERDGVLLCRGGEEYRSQDVTGDTHHSTEDEERTQGGV